MEILFRTNNGLIRTNAPENTLRHIWRTYHQLRYDFEFPSFHRFLQENGFSARKVNATPFTYEGAGRDISMN